VIGVVDWSLGRVRFVKSRMTVRLRLTLLYGGMFFAAGVLLLSVAYVLVANILEGLPLAFTGDDPFAAPTPEQMSAWRHQWIDEALHQLIWQSALALFGVGLIALALGWFVADRALAPLQRVTTAARRLSESTLHQRIAMQGPDDEIKELADTFDAMLGRLNQAFDAQRRFVGNASHELRTPLAINRTLLEVALTDPEASDDLKSIGRTLLANNARHERLIEGLLLLARTERELTTHTPVDLREVTVTVLANAAARIEDDGPKFITELTDAPTTGDPVLLEHLVSNLVDNAIKHNLDEGGEVIVRTGVLDGYAACQVENTGPVIPAYEVQNLFEPFRRLNNDRVESAKGAGLGLSIVRSVVIAHGGTVVASPRAAGGLVVTVRLPSAGVLSEDL
jgi:signal transduction histidine kinase